MPFHQIIQRLLKKYTPEEKKLEKAVAQILGKRPRNIHLYKLAMQHSSIATENEKGLKESNERLEYLGDAFLGAVVAEFLFKKYPYKDEGFLTEIRSRIVNRESLNNLAIKIGVSQLVRFEGKTRNAAANYHAFKSIYGDAIEAFLGAIYLDFGFRFCQQFIIDKLLIQHYDLEEIVDTTTNFKSMIIEWSQKNNRELNFHIDEVNMRKSQRQFRVGLFVDGNKLADGIGFSKKKAEQSAAQKACEALQLI